MQLALILTLFNAGSIAKLAVLWRSIASGALKRLPCFFAMVLVSFARTAIAPTGKLHPYYEIWQATTWPTAILQAAAVIEAFWGLARHFRGIRNFAWALLSLILAVTAAAASVVGFMKTRWNSPLRTPLLIDQYTGLWLVLTALLSLAFFRQFRQVPVRPNAIRHMAALSLLFGANFAGYSIAQLSHGEWKFLTNLIVLSGAVCAYSWWALTINSDGELLPFPLKPPMSYDDFNAAEAQHQKTARELKQAGRSALRRLLGW